jgi:anti-anti-sigma regulatory factor
MLRITEVPTVPLTTIRLEGKLLFPWLQEVRTAVAAAQTHGLVRLNLEDLHFVDSEGVELLRGLKSTGVEIYGCTAFVDGLLNLRDRH